MTIADAVHELTPRQARDALRAWKRLRFRGPLRAVVSIQRAGAGARADFEFAAGFLNVRPIVVRKIAESFDSGDTQDGLHLALRRRAKERV